VTGSGDNTPTEFVTGSRDNTSTEFVTGSGDNTPTEPLYFLLTRGDFFLSGFLLMTVSEFLRRFFFGLTSDVQSDRLFVEGRPKVLFRIFLGF